MVSKNIKIDLQTLFDPSLGRRSVSPTGKHTGDRSLTILEDFNAQ